ncbi:MAG: amino acid ABC transporter permease [Eggerthella lenta]
MSDIAALFTWVNMRFLLQGLGMTLLISALAILCSVVLGTVISVMRTSNARVLRGIATVYIEIFKNTPLLLWIMFTFFVAQLPPIGAAVLAFTLFTSASVAEIVRGGLASVPHGQYEAARSQGFSTVQTYVLIILPQALRNMVPALLSQFVTTIKDTSYLWGAMALQELMGRGMILMNSYNSTAQIFAIFGIMALIYFIVCFTLSQIVRAYQRRLKEARAGRRLHGASSHPERSAKSKDPARHRTAFRRLKCRMRQQRRAYAAKSGFGSNETSFSRRRSGDQAFSRQLGDRASSRGVRNVQTLPKVRFCCRSIPGNVRETEFAPRSEPFYPRAACLGCRRYCT